MTRFVTRRALVAVALLGAMGAGAVVSAQRGSNAMVSAATRFLEGLTPEQRKQAVFSLDSQERLRWNFIPDETFPRNGLPLKAMTEPQRKLAHEMLKTGLSERGYLTYTAIIQLENILRQIEGGVKIARDPDAYRFSIFGEPAAGGTWGWRVEGHHISLHFTMMKGRVVASTPSFAGSNPAEVRDGPQKGQRTLAVLEDTARSLAMTFDEQQRQVGIINATAPNEIVTTNTLDINPLSPTGLSAAAMTAAQRDMLMKVIDAYAGLMATEIAADRMAKIKAAGLEKVAFAWAGPVERGQRHYYRVQGPTFLIEFDNSQGMGNHVHSVWRDFQGDFGRDLLREHIKTAHQGNDAGFQGAP